MRAAETAQAVQGRRSARPAFDLATGEVTFLDLAISHRAGSIQFRLYEKPLAQYLYVPWGSCHSTSIKLGIAIAGLIRISRRLSRDSPVSEISDARHRFLSRLRARGFPASA